MGIRVGFVGLGTIGLPIAQRLVEAGLDTIVFDRREEPCRKLEEAGARVASSCAEVARDADVVGVCVRDDADVREVTMGPDGVADNAPAGAVIALHSTILPSTVREVAHAASARGVGVVDASVSGGAAGAQRGKLTYMVGGDAELVARCRPVFETSAAKIVHTGPLGTGAATKLCHAIMTYLGFLAAFETTLLARHAGLSGEALEEVTRSSGVMTDQTLAFVRMRRTVESRPDDAELQATLRNFTDLAEKDLELTLSFAREQGVALPGAGLCQQLMARVYGIEDEKRR